MTDNDLNEQVNVTVDDASVITVPIDATLQNSNEAADAKAVGDALALKADKSELQAAVKVNNQPADAQGLILIDGRHIPVSDQNTETLANAVTDLKGKTAADIPMSSDSDAKTIAEVVNANSEAIEGMEEMTGATMPIESGSQTTVKAAIEARVKTVNRKAPDADGDVDLSVVPLAENLQSDKMESVEGAFIIRTTGGNASVSDGKAYPLHLFGAAEHTGYVAEELNMTVIPITRTEPDEPITATIDRDTFVAYVDESSTINLYYTTEWSADPELYGITVTGTPVAGDQITVVYVKEVRGTITVANPARLVGTGWNLFDYNNGYARVVKYSTEYGYKIGGSYASLQFSATLTGERSSITPGVDGLFNVPSDGYVFVTGGNNTDTYILNTWSDWMEGPSSGYWEPYRESGIDLSAVMTTYFPNGLLAVGTTSDEIDLSAKRSISRIERMAYSEENRAAAAASGRSYDFDQNYIYIVRESAVISAITIDTTYNVSEHGLEWFTETTLPVISEILYGKNLRDKLERDVVTISAQTLTEEEKAQVRTNIGAMSQADGDKKLVAPTTAGTNGQLLQTNGDGTTKWTTQGTPTDAQVGTAVSAWLTAHPEATTTVQDGAISRAKLNDDLKAKTDAVPDLKSAFTYTDSVFERENNVLKNAIGTVTIDDYEAITITTESGAIQEENNLIKYVSTPNYKYAVIDIALVKSNEIKVSLESTTSASYPYYVYGVDAIGTVVYKAVEPQKYSGQYTYTIAIPADVAKLYIMSASTGTLSASNIIYKSIDKKFDETEKLIENSVGVAFVTTSIPTFDFTNSKFIANAPIDVYINGQYKANIDTGNYTIPNLSSMPNKVLMYYNSASEPISYSGSALEKPLIGYYIKSEKQIVFYPCKVTTIGASSIEDISNTERQVALEETLINAAETQVVSWNRYSDFLTFAYVTDTHYYEADVNSTRNVRLLDEIGERRFVDFCAHGGDVINYYEEGEAQPGVEPQGISQQEALNRFYMAMKPLGNIPVPLYVARGNHDWNKYGTNGIISHTMFAKLCIDRFTGEVDGRYLLSYYKDYNQYGIRVIVLDVNMGDESGDATQSDAVLSWFSTTALDLTESITNGVLILTHIRNFRTFTTIVQSFISSGGKVIAQIFGDSHSDNIYTDSGFLQINVSTAYNRIETTESNNYCVSIFVIDTTNKVVRERRIGRGSVTREESYEI